MLEIKFDTAGNIEQPTLVLAYRNGNKIGVLSNVSSLVVRDSFGNPIELSFMAYKNICPYWDKLQDFRAIWVKEWDRWFEVHVDVNKSYAETKFVTATHLPESELSQRKIFTTEINTENDISYGDENYTGSVFFDDINPKASLLHRITDKVKMNFKFVWVDESLKNLWREFNFDNITIYDALLEIAEEIHCLFVFGTEYGKETGKLWRTISVYDLEDYCSECGHREETMDVCPVCGNKNIDHGFGQDTGIFLSTDNVLDEVNYSSNVDSYKNCFKLEAGDELMTAAVMSCNPTGSDYIWVPLSETTMADMSDDLKSALAEYQILYDRFTSTQTYGGDDDFLLNVDAYNDIVNTYTDAPFNNKTQPVSLPIVGHSQLMELYFDAIDMELYLESGMMPIPSMGDTTAEDQAELVTKITSVAVSNQSSLTSESTVKNSVRAMAEAIIDSRYKAETTTISLDSAKWTGTVKIINRSNEEDNATITLTNVVVTTDYEQFVKEKIDKAIAKCEDTDYCISGIFSLDHDSFANELTQYGKTSLERFHESCNAVLNVLTEQGIGNPDNFDDDSDSTGSEFLDPQNNLYKKIYLPYYEKLQAIEAEITIRENQIFVVTTLQDEITSICETVADTLNLEEYLYHYNDIETDSLWAELNLFRREDIYINSNYISDGKNNAEIFNYARQFLEVANREIEKASTLQHSITVTMKNIFTIKELEPLRKGFSVGNWLRVQADGGVHKLRLLSYEIDYENYQNVPVEFSDVEKIQNDIEDIKNTLNTMESIATSFDYVERQADKSIETTSTVHSFIDDGLDMTYTKIINSATGQTQTWDSNGMLFRSLDDISGEYSPEQMKIINSTIVITDDNWNSVKTAIGKFIYYDPVSKTYKEGYGINGEVLVGKVIIGETLTMANKSGSLLFNENGFLVKTGDTERFKIDPNGNVEINANKFVVSSDDTFIVDSDNFKVDEDGLVTVTGTIHATDGEFTGKITTGEGEIAKWLIKDNYLYSGGTGLSSSTGKYAFWAGETNGVFGTLDRSNASFTVTHTGKLNATGATITGAITADTLETTGTGKIACWNFNNDSLYIGSPSFLTEGCVYLGVYGLGLGKNFYVDSSGAMEATNAKITGNITATSVKIKDKLYMYTDTLSEKLILDTFEWLDTGYAYLIIGEGCTGVSIKNATFWDDNVNIYTDTSVEGDLSVVGELNLSKHINMDNAKYIYTNSYGETATYFSLIGCSSSDNIWIGDYDKNFFAEHCYIVAKNIYKTTSGGNSSLSDARYKNDFTTINNYRDFIMNIKPYMYKFNDGSSNRYHMGFKAQQIEEVMLETIGDTGVVVKYSLDESIPVDLQNPETYIMGLRYEEFIAPHIMLTQNHEIQIQQLKQEIESLKEVIKQLTA